MHPKEFNHDEIRRLRGEEHAPPAIEYRVELRFSVDCARQLWAGAFHKALAESAMTLDQVYARLGPREAPSVENCIALLTDPSLLPGCTLDKFQVTELPAPHTLSV